MSLLLISWQPGFGDSENRFVHPIYPWSVSYPSSWTLDDRDPDFIQVRSNTVFGLCGFHTKGMPYQTADQFADAALDHNKQYLESSGLKQTILSRKKEVRPDSHQAIDVLIDIVQGGRSRRLFILTDGIGILIDCETYTHFWKDHEAVFDLIFDSFQVVQ